MRLLRFAVRLLLVVLVLIPGFFVTAIVLTGRR